MSISDYKQAINTKQTYQESPQGFVSFKCFTLVGGVTSNDQLIANYILDSRKATNMSKHSLIPKPCVRVWNETSEKNEQEEKLLAYMVPYNHTLRWVYVFISIPQL